MSQCPRPSASLWLLYLVGPTWIISCLAVLAGLLEPSEADSVSCRNITPVMLIGLYGTLSLFAGLPFLARFRLRSVAAFFIPALIAPSLLVILMHHAGNVPPGGPWQEVIVPSAAVIWIGMAGVLMHTYNGLCCGVSARWAVLVSACIVFLGIGGCIHHRSLPIIGALCVYTFPILWVAARDEIRATRSKPAPS